MSFIAYDYPKSLHPPERTEQIFSYSFFSSRLSHFNFNRHSIWTTLHDVTMMFSNLYQKYRSAAHLEDTCVLYMYICHIFQQIKFLRRKKNMSKNIRSHNNSIELNVDVCEVCMYARVCALCMCIESANAFFMCPRYRFICFPSSCPFALGISALF